VFQAVDEPLGFEVSRQLMSNSRQMNNYGHTALKRDDPDHFDDMKRFITATIKAALRKNRNNNRDFMVYIEPIGVEEIPDEETAGEAEDEMIPGL
jgi:hypothetical protein